MRHPAGPVRRPGPVSRRGFARRLCAGRPGRSGRRGPCDAQGARPGGDLRQAALHRVRRRALRPRPFADHGMQPVSGGVPRRRHRPSRRPCGCRRRNLRRLRPVRRRLPDRRGRLRPAAGQRSPAPDPGAADGLPLRRRPAADRASARRPARRAFDRCPGPGRRWPAGQCHAARPQRDHPGRPGDGGGRLRLWRLGAALPGVGQASPRGREPLSNRPAGPGGAGRLRPGVAAAGRHRGGRSG